MKAWILITALGAAVLWMTYCWLWFVGRREERRGTLQLVPRKPRRHYDVSRRRLINAMEETRRARGGAA